jgi:hypothetical protein
MVHVFHYNIAHADPAVLEAYCYTDRISVRPGETVSIHASATAKQVDITIIRDGLKELAEQADTVVRTRNSKLTTTMWESAGVGRSRRRLKPLAPRMTVAELVAPESPG